MSVNIKRVFSCPRSSSLQQKQQRQGGRETMTERRRERERESGRRRDEERKRPIEPSAIQPVATTASFRCQKQQCTQSIKLSSRSKMRNYHNWIRKDVSHFQSDDFPRRKGKRGDARVMQSKGGADSPGMPGGVFRYFPLKCCITTSHFSVDSILQPKEIKTT